MSNRKSSTSAWIAGIAAVVVVAALVGLVVYLNKPSSTYRGPARAPRVLVVGDSITVLSASAIQKALDQQVRLRIEAKFGQRTDQMLGRLESGITDPEGRPAAIIVNLGTNDALQQHPDPAKNFLRIATKADSAPCLVLTTVNVRKDPKAQRVVDIVNNTLGAFAFTHPNVRIADWKRVVQAHPDYLLPGDQVHPNAQGQTALAQLYVQALRSCPNHVLG